MKGITISGRVLEKARLLWSIDELLQNCMDRKSTSSPASSESEEVRRAPVSNLKIKSIMTFRVSRKLEVGGASNYQGELTAQGNEDMAFPVNQEHAYGTPQPTPFTFQQQAIISAFTMKNPDIAATILNLTPKFSEFSILNPIQKAVQHQTNIFVN
ncbi:hypothetical protein NE237_025690 [Protea cynaroides]|uniref:Uncharacterized protein n=1 Tax=Protea cynaroides TaxID=273540 RepID=A0A9Q0JZS8_9MAGN|nr:hypothetical protein NE237_025690 [Protea cynaroides]